MNTWGQLLKLSIFGESHGPGLGLVVDGLPAGEIIALDKIKAEMSRRAPGRDALSTARKESDEVQIISGLKGDRTTGAPICGLIMNSDARSSDYKPMYRPGHADWTARLKYGEHVDLRGGGHFSGRLTAALVFGGSLAKQVLDRRGIAVYGRIVSLAGVADSDVPQTLEARQALMGHDLPVSDQAVAAEMRAEVLAAKSAGDSVGGVVEAVAFGLPGGLGEPFFGSVESVLASMLFSIPAVKGVEFGEGFKFAGLRGSQANDQLTAVNSQVRGLSNHNGGVLGGITSGQPLVVRVAVKPTPSIALPQQSVDPNTMAPTTLTIGGRHDPAIVPRAVAVVEAAVALAVLDLALVAGKIKHDPSTD